MAEITQEEQSLLDHTESPQLDHTKSPQEERLLHPSCSAICYTIFCQLAMISFFILMILNYRWYLEQYNDSAYKNKKSFWSLTNAFYFSIVTFTTVGYGDIVPNSACTKVMTILCISLGFVGLNYIMNFANDVANYAADRFFPNIFRKTAIARLLVAFFSVCFWIVIGAVCVYFIEHQDWLDSFYLVVVSATSVGYGDLAFQTVGGRKFAMIWMVFTFIAMAVFSSSLNGMKLSENEYVLENVMKQLKESATVTQKDVEKFKEEFKEVKCDSIIIKSMWTLGKWICRKIVDFGKWVWSKIKSGGSSVIDWWAASSTTDEGSSTTNEGEEGSALIEAVEGGEA